jgi:hypothetical protein
MHCEFDLRILSVLRAVGVHSECVACILSAFCFDGILRDSRVLLLLFLLLFFWLDSLGQCSAIRRFLWPRAREGDCMSG